MYAGPTVQNFNETFLFLCRSFLGGLSQYPGLWSVTGTPLTSASPPSGSLTGGLTSQFLRSSPVSYTSLSSSSLTPSSSSPMYDTGLAEVGGGGGSSGDAQFESSIARLTASWTTPVAQSYWVAPAPMLVPALPYLVSLRVKNRTDIP